MDGKYWPTSEHYFQSQKFAGTVWEDKIRYAESPMKAAKMGRDKSKPLRSDWDKVRNIIMKRAVLQKFVSHKELKDLLISTGEEEIIEETVNDYYWGCGHDGTGANMLGKILMDVRTAIRLGSENIVLFQDSRCL